MKTNKFLAMMLFAIIALATVSCEKEEDNPNVRKPKDDTPKVIKEITQRDWYLSAIYQKGYGGVPYVDINEDGKITKEDYDLTIDDCEKDNKYIFQKDGTYKVNSFNIPCGSEEANTIVVKGTWEYKKEEYNPNPTIIIKTEGDTDTFFDCEYKEKTRTLELSQKKKVKDTQS